MPRGRPRRQQEHEEIEMSPREIADMFKERICSKHLRDRMWNLLKQKDEQITCCVCMEVITSSTGYLLLTCGHDQCCASCWNYIKEPQLCPICKS